MLLFFRSVSVRVYLISIAIMYPVHNVSMRAMHIGYALSMLVFYTVLVSWLPVSE